jgi:hypothetical protein
MTEPHVLSALRLKRAEISGHIHDLEKRIARQRASLANLDATIKLFSPGTNPDAIPPKRVYRRTRYFAHNELSRLTQDAMRTASRRLTSAEIAAVVMQAKGMAPGDAAFKEIVVARALTVLRRLVKRGTAVKSGTSRNAKCVVPPKRRGDCRAPQLRCALSSEAQYLTGAKPMSSGNWSLEDGQPGAHHSMS